MCVRVCVLSHFLLHFVSSEEDEGVGSKHQCHVTQHTGVMVNSGGWSDDEFETEMESELVSVLKSVASSDILVATATAAASQTNSREIIMSLYTHTCAICVHILYTHTHTHTHAQYTLFQ